MNSENISRDATCGKFLGRLGYGCVGRGAQYLSEIVEVPEKRPPELAPHDPADDRHQCAFPRYVRDRPDTSLAVLDVPEPRFEPATSNRAAKEDTFAAHELSFDPFIGWLDPFDVEAELLRARRSHTLAFVLAPRIPPRRQPTGTIPTVRIREKPPHREPRSFVLTLEAGFVDTLSHRESDASSCRRGAATTRAGSP